MFRSARLRLTAWHVGVLALLLSSACLSLYLLLRHNYFERADGVLTSVDAATVAMLGHQLSENGLDELAARDAVKTLNFPEHTLAIFDAQGDLLAEKPVGTIDRIPLEHPEQLTDGRIKLYTTPSRTRPSDLRRVAVLRVTLEPLGRSYFVISSRSLTPLLGELDTDRRILLLAVPIGLLIAGLAAWFLVRITLQPVAAMSERARILSAQNLEQRLPVPHTRDEFSQLAETFNDLLGRLGSTFSLQRQFFADASHELRTPVSVIRTTAAVTLQSSGRTEQEYIEALDVIQGQAQRLTRMVDDMFRLARADAGGLTLNLSVFYLDEIVHEAVRATRVLALNKGVSIHTADLPECLCRGDSDLLRQLCVILLDNAVKYTPPGGAVFVDLSAEPEGYKLSIRDTGIGIAEEHRDQVFHRFFRIDRSHSNSTTNPHHNSGAGLGLPIARSIAETHHGKLILAPTQGNGSLFVATIPAEPPDSPL